MPTPRTYTILFPPDPTHGGYWVSVPTLPGCHNQGDSLEAAIANARETIRAYLDDLGQATKRSRRSASTHRRSLSTSLREPSGTRATR